MYKSSVTRSVSSPPPTASPVTHVTHPDSTSGSHYEESRIFDHRFPSRFRPSAAVQPRPPRTEPRRESSVTRSHEFQIQRLKTLNSELQAKLQLKNQENNQLKLELSRLKSDHERALRQAQLQQKTATEQMVRTLKHAEDIIKDKEKMIRRQEETMRKIPVNAPKMVSAPFATTFGGRQPSRTPPTRHRSFHGSVRSREASTESPTSFRRTSSLRAKPVENDQNVNPLGVVRPREPVPPGKAYGMVSSSTGIGASGGTTDYSLPGVGNSESMATGRPVSSSTNILDLSEKSLWLRQRSRPVADNDLKANRHIVQRKQLTTLPDTDGYRSQLEMVL